MQLAISKSSQVLIMMVWHNSFSFFLRFSTVVDFTANMLSIGNCLITRKIHFQSHFENIKVKFYRAQILVQISGGAVRSQMYLNKCVQIESFHIPERLGFPSTGSAQRKRHWPRPNHSSPSSHGSQAKKDTKSPLAGPLPSPCLITPVERMNNYYLP